MCERDFIKQQDDKRSMLKNRLCQLARLIRADITWRSARKAKRSMLSAYPNNPEALKAMRAQAKWRNAR